MRNTEIKGILMPIGGAEDKTGNREVLCRFIEETGKKTPRVCLITVATNIPEELIRDYKKAFKAINHTLLSTIHFDTRSEADQKKHLEMIRKSDAVLFSGGDQLKLSSLMGGTKLLALIKDRYTKEKDFVIAGTSAGAAAMSDTMIISGSSEDALIKGELELTNGLDFIDSVFIDTHFIERGRFGRLIQTLAYNPGVVGVGLGENTAIIIRKGKELEVVGSGLVMIADGTNISYTDLMEIENGEPITVEGIKIHVLGPGKRFLLSEKKIIKEKKKPPRKK
jgi:cyanophycinase